LRRKKWQGRDTPVKRKCEKTKNLRIHPETRGTRSIEEERAKFLMKRALNLIGATKELKNTQKFVKQLFVIQIIFVIE